MASLYASSLASMDVKISSMCKFMIADAVLSQRI